MADPLATPGAESIELHDLTPGVESDIDNSNPGIAALPRADGGRQAYQFLAACFVLEATVWGFPLCFGVFQTYYSTHEPFASSPTAIPAIATTATGLMYLGAPLVAWILARWPYIRQRFIWVGFAGVVASLVGASFANTTASLLATQGVLYAVFGLALYFPFMMILDEWFINRKGFAFGVMWAGLGTSGSVYPFLMQWLLDKYGYRTALRVWAVIFTSLVLPSVLVAKPRLPITPTHRVRPSDWSFLKNSATFWFFEVGVIFQGLGFFLPQLYIPSYVASAGFPSYAGPLALSLYNVLATFSSILVGTLSDRYDVTTVILMGSVGSAIACFVFWGLASSQAMFYLFVLLWGLFAGGFSTTWSGSAVAVRKAGSQNIDVSSVMSLFAAGKGIGSIVSGPMSQSLLQKGAIPHSGFVYGTKYGSLVLFTGAAVIMGAFGSIARLRRR